MKKKFSAALTYKVRGEDKKHCDVLICDSQEKLAEQLGVLLIQYAYGADILKIDWKRNK